MKYKWKIKGTELRNHANYYGILVSLEAEKEYPVICGHGGSMWLCPQCAHEITQFEQFMNEKTEITFNCPICPLCSRPIYPNSAWTIWTNAEYNLVAVHKICLQYEQNNTPSCNMPMKRGRVET